MIRSRRFVQSKRFWDPHGSSAVARRQAIEATSLTRANRADIPELRAVSEPQLTDETIAADRETPHAVRKSARK